MTRFEDRLTDLLRQASDGIDVSPALTRTALADARRNQRKTLVLGAGAGLLGTGVVAAGAFALAAPTHQKLEVVPGSSAGALPRGGTTAGCTTDAAVASPPPGDPIAASGLAAKGQLGSAVPVGNVPATALPGGGTTSTTVTATSGKPANIMGGGKPIPSEPAKPAGLDDISLPNPAPGFPLRRDPDSSFVQSGSDGTDSLEWTRFFAVETSAPHVEQLGCGAYGSTPTGPEATIMVVPRFAGDTAGQKVEGSFPVTSTVTARGTTAYVSHQSDKEAYDILQVSTDKWTVIVTGDWGTTVPEMVTLANALQNI